MEIARQVVNGRGHSGSLNGVRHGRAGASAGLVFVLLLSGCAPLSPSASIDRMTPAQLAALAPASPEQAAEATRLTQRADREAHAAREAESARQRELARASRLNEYRRLHPYPSVYGPLYGPYPRWSAGIGYGPGPYVRPGWGTWYGF